METRMAKNIASTAAYLHYLSVSLAHLFVFFTSVFMQIYERTYSPLSYIENTFFVVTPLNFLAYYILESLREGGNHSF